MLEIWQRVVGLDGRHHRHYLLQSLYTTLPTLDIGYITKDITGVLGVKVQTKFCRYDLFDVIPFTRPLFVQKRRKIRGLGRKSRNLGPGIFLL